MLWNDAVEWCCGMLWNDVKCCGMMLWNGAVECCGMLWNDAAECCGMLWNDAVECCGMLWNDAVVGNKRRFDFAEVQKLWNFWCKMHIYGDSYIS